VQSDPLGLGGGLSTYAYALSNSLSLADRFGLFAGDGHSLITKQALNGEKCIDVDRLAKLTQDVDSQPGSQKAANSYKHAMRDGTSGQSAAQAEQLYNSFIESELSKCNLEGLANAMHAVQDSAAAGHKGFQPWDGGPLPSFGYFLRDMIHPGDAEWEDAKDKSRQLLERFKRKCPCSCK
jgi:hypothetical protein